MRQVKRWMPYGLAFGAVVVLLVLSYSEASMLPQKLPAAGPAKSTSMASSTSTLHGLAVDVIDGKTVAEAWIETVDPQGRTTSRPVTAADGLTWTIQAGTSAVHQDAFSGKTLFTPSGDVPVVARPEMPGLTGGPVSIGINAEVISMDERGLIMNSGGACPARWQASVGLAPREVDVRAVVDLSAIPLSKTERVMIMKRAQYYAYDPQLGPMKITMSPDRISSVTLRSLDPTGGKFFPATAEARVYFVFEMLNSGVRVFNSEPMVYRNSATEWPPFKEPMLSEGEVPYYLVDNPAVEMLRVWNEEAYIYPTDELQVELLSQHAEGDVLEASYRIHNRTPAGGDVRWFFLGDLGTPLTPAEGLAAIQPNGQLDVSLRTRLKGSELTQSITLGAVSQSGVRLTGKHRLELLYSAAPGTVAVLPAQPGRAGRRGGTR